jgi:two-component system sensor histidine kinase KdpD
MAISPDRYSDGDTLLAHVQGAERQKGRGKLKIFLGYIAGVGKTHEMIRAAHLRKNEGVDVVVGYVETHNRPEIEVLLEGLTIIPRRMMDYKGVKLSEFDIDTVLALHPALVLVDELAHTNVQGSRHQKRYQDVEELLDAGINVYTTLNIQHVESLNDVIAQITSVVVRETIPDAVIDGAIEIDVVDLAPPKLLQRLRDGKVYVANMAARAIDRFFNESNLVTLRELAFRCAEERVDSQMLAYVQTHAIPQSATTDKHILVCVAPDALSERLVRTAWWKADRTNASLSVLYVETPSHHLLTKKEKDQLSRTMKFAEKLGATTATVFGLNVAKTAIEYARQHNVTRIIIGKTLRPRWQEFIFGSIDDQIVHNSGTVEVDVISSEGYTPKKLVDLDYLLPTTPFRDYLICLAFIILITGIGWPVKTFIPVTIFAMIYLLAIFYVAWRRGLLPAIITTVVSALAFDFFLTPPYLSFLISNTADIITFLGMIIVGTLISVLVARLRGHSESALIREKETGTIFALSQDLAIAMDTNSILTAVAKHINDMFKWQSTFLLPEGERVVEHTVSPGLVLDADERAIAQWVYKHREVAGYDTDTLHGSRIRFVPLQSHQRVLGVMAVKPTEPKGVITPEQSRILSAFANQAALALERVNLATARGRGV